MLDAVFLHAEDSDRHVSLAIGALSVLAGPMPDFDSLATGSPNAYRRCRGSASPAHTAARSRRSAMGGRSQRRHLPSRTALRCPVPATMRLCSGGSPRSWSAASIETVRCGNAGSSSLQHNRWAILMKIHHCIADGIAATYIFARLCDDGGADTFATQIRAAHEPTRSGPRLPALSFNPIDWIAGAWRTSLGVTTAAAQALQGAVEIAGGLLRPAAASSLTNMRRYATVEVSLEDVARVCDRFEVTVNDVALAAITDSFRTMLMRRGEQPQHNSVRTLVPVSVRSNDAADKTDNRVSVMLPHLPVDKADPVAQLRTVHARLTRAKTSGQRQAGNIFVSAANAVPFPVTAWTVRALTRLPQRGVVTLATNVPGPRKRLRIMGREVIRLLPTPPLAMQLRTGIAILSYANHLVFGSNPRPTD
jgi:diacylglycerol O-acyltransferase / wax synthase